MTNTLFMRKKLRAGSALQALALLGAGVGASAAFVAPASAQDFQNVTASGKVQGTNGQAIGGATVAITSNAQGFTRTTTTTSDGSYRVGQLPIGTYTFTVSADGYDTFTDNNVPLSLNAGGNTFTLAGGNSAEAGDIVVTAGRTTVSSLDQTTTGAVIKVSELANRVPVSRSLTSIIRLTPGTAAGDSAFGDLPSISGSSVGENQYFINGLNVTDFRNFLGSNSVPFEFYDTVDVKDGGYPAEFGRATGGFVSATTKSGSNEFHAGAVVTYEPAGLASHAPNTFSSDNDADSSSDLRSDFYVSGPIIKDHLFFYALYEAREVKSAGSSDNAFDYNLPIDPTNINPNTRTRTHTSSPFYAAKVDAVITDGQRLEFTYFRTTGSSRNDQYCYRYTDNSDINCQDPNTGEYNKAPYVGSSISQYGGDNFVGRYTGSFTDWLTISAAYGESNNRENTIASKDTPLVLDNRNAALGQITISPNPGYFQTTNEDKRQFYRGDVDIYAHLLGSHHFRFGVDHETLKTTGITNYSSGFYYQIFHTTAASICGTPAPAGGCDYIRGRDFENGGSFNTYNQAYYAEDSWSLFNDRLTLNLGIRNDRFKNNNVADVTYYKSGNQWGPRLGFTYDVFGDKRTKVYGSFSRYFLPIAANTNIRLGGAEYDVYSYYKFGGLNSDGTPILGTPIVRPGHCIRNDPTYPNVTDNCTVASDGSVADTASTVSQNLKPQAEDEYILGFEQKIGSRWTVGAYYTYRKLNDALEDSAIDAAARRYCEAQPDPNNAGHNFSAADCSYIYQGFSQYVLNNPGSPIVVQLQGLPDGSTPVVTLTDIGYPKAKRHYKGMTFKFDREFDGKWELHGSYTFSKAIGNYEGSVTSDNGQTDAGLTQDFDQPQLTWGSYGYLPNHHLHNFKLYGSYQLTDWLQLGANVDVQSPRKFGCFGVLPTGGSNDPFNAIINSAYGAAARYCPYKDGKVDDTYPIVQVRRGTGPQSDWFTELDLTAAVTIPTDAFQGVVRFDVFNVFNSHAVTDLYEFGTTDGGAAQSDVYGKPTGYQQPRYARVQLQLRF